MGLDHRGLSGAAMHDATLVEQAIDGRRRIADAAHERLAAADRRLDAAQQAEARRIGAAANAAELRAQGRRAVMFAAAAALVMLAGGLALRLAQVRATPVAAAPAAPVSAGIIVTDYVIFTERRAAVAGAEFRVQAGHRFADERAATFEAAWCYVQGIAGGLPVRLDLGALAPGEAPVASPDPFTRAALGLNAGQEAELFRACPWQAFAPDAAGG
jgi:hypothetical protein